MKSFKTALRSIIAIALLAVMLCSEALAAAIPVYINTQTRIYNRPSSSALSISSSSTKAGRSE